MSGNSIALDANVAVDLINRANAAILAYSPVYLPAPALGELRFGALNSARHDENLARLERFEQQCLVLAVTRETTVAYAQVRWALKRLGKPIPENDLWIAALCIEHSIPLATRDAHFREVDSLTLISF